MNVRPLLTPLTLLAALVLPLAACAAGGPGADKRPAPRPVAKDGQALATFAGGCFWCMEPPFEKLPGVISVTSGYTGGPERSPTYEQVSSGATGHTEAIQVLYDPKRVSYERLLETFWRNIDPTQSGGQFCDRGGQYRSGIFWHDAAQRRQAEASLTKLGAERRFKQPIVTEITRYQAFWPAENYHQDYYRKNPAEYHAYRAGCGRDARLEQLWGRAAAKR